MTCEKPRTPGRMRGFKWRMPLPARSGGSTSGASFVKGSGHRRLVRSRRPSAFALVFLVLDAGHVAVFRLRVQPLLRPAEPPSTGADKRRRDRIAVADIVPITAPADSAAAAP